MCPTHFGQHEWVYEMVDPAFDQCPQDRLYDLTALRPALQLDMLLFILCNWYIASSR